MNVVKRSQLTTRLFGIMSAPNHPRPSPQANGRGGSGPNKRPRGSGPRRGGGAAGGVARAMHTEIAPPHSGVATGATTPAASGTATPAHLSQKRFADFTGLAADTLKDIPHEFCTEVGIDVRKH
jgi:hypothetical protein